MRSLDPLRFDLPAMGCLPVVDDVARARNIPGRVAAVKGAVRTLRFSPIGLCSTGLAPLCGSTLALANGAG
jgi:hypothetical protein